MNDDGHCDEGVKDEVTNESVTNEDDFNDQRSQNLSASIHDSSPSNKIDHSNRTVGGDEILDEK